MRSSAYRAGKYRKKLSGSVSKNRTEALRRMQAAQFTNAIGEQVQIEKKVKQILDTHGCSVITIPYYIIFGKKLAKLQKKYQGTVFATEACIEANKWSERELDDFILEDILYLHGVICVSLQELKTGMILMWHGTIATIPAGWALCDGNNSTPDLRNRFIVCADADSGGQAKTTFYGGPFQSGGSANHTHTFTGAQHQHVIGPGADIAAGANYFATTDYAAAFGTTFTESVAPVPYYALAYIMKL